MIHSWCSRTGVGVSALENGVVKFKCKAQSIVRSFAISAALFESSMKTMALADDTVPIVQQSSIRLVVSASLPQSSALMINAPGYPPGDSATALSVLPCDKCVSLILASICAERRRITRLYWIRYRTQKIQVGLASGRRRADERVSSAAAAVLADETAPALVELGGRGGAVLPRDNRHPALVRPHRQGCASSDNKPGRIPRADDSLSHSPSARI